MDIHYITDSSPIHHETVATVGFFDGVHRGHRYLIDRMKEQARMVGLKTAIITFPLHPRKVLQQDYQPKLLNSFEERIGHLASTGIDYGYILPFSREFSEIPARDFIQKILCKQLKIKVLLIGYNHKFGKDRIDAYDQYAAYGQACGMIIRQVEELPPTDGYTSSTAIRRMIMEGKIREATATLSYAYTLEGEVVHGNHLGKTIGYPTANLDLNEKDKILPHEGVYAVEVEVEGRQYGGMAYIGKRPTITSNGEQRIEVNIFDFDKDIYGEQLRIKFTEFLRPDIRFDNLDQLKTQLAQDKCDAIDAYGTPINKTASG